MRFRVFNPKNVKKEKSAHKRCMQRVLLSTVFVNNLMFLSVGLLVSLKAQVLLLNSVKTRQLFFYGFKK
jgi:hypothetical protein